jgi:class 3 adenylate cyclase
MEQRIQYAQTHDGVSIAHYSGGSGPGLPIVWMELPSHLTEERKLFPEQVRAYDAIMRSSALVRYDHRGFGLSDREVTEFPLAALVADIEAVAEKLGLGRFILMAMGGFTGPVAISYAASHPEQVAKLVLHRSFVSIPPSVREQIRGLILPGSDWRFVSESFVRLFLGWNDEANSRKLAEWYRAASTLEALQRLWLAAEGWDVTDQLELIQSPTLVTAQTDEVLAGPEQARRITTVVPGAQFVVGTGETYEQRVADLQRAVASFLFGQDVAPHPLTRSSVRTSGTAIILFADIVDSTALTERLGDAAFRERARGLDGAMRNLITDNGGICIDAKTLGDGVLATFTSARQAIEAARACATAGDEGGLPLHLGLHAGDVIREEDNVFGGAVNIASRISGLSAPGEVLVSQTVRDLARTSAGVSFEDRGEQSLKGVGEPVRVWAVRKD